MRYTGSKNKLARREGADLGYKTPGSKSHASLLKRINLLPGQHGARGRRKISERGRQLREKQKLRFLFGVTERSLKKYFTKAKNKEGNTALYLSQLLEGRLDNLVFRSGLAPTRASARQLVSHGHVKVNGKRVTIASYQVKPSDEVTLKDEKTMKIPYVEATVANKNVIIPSWIERAGITGKLISSPSSEEIEKQVDLRSVIEFYSR